MDEYLIDQILPSQEIHLLAGPTGAGKTRWLLQALKNQWEKGLPVLGFESHPVPWCYVSTDRSMRDCYKTFKSIGINPLDMNIIPAWGKEYKSMAQILDAIGKLNAKLAVIEGFQSFSDSIDKQRVKDHLRSIQTQADDGLTVIGVCESPKMKPHEVYANPRQRVSGVAAWGHFSNTIFLVEPASATPGDPGRLLTVCPRHAPDFQVAANIAPSGVLEFPAPKPANWRKVAMSDQRRVH